MNVQAYHQLYPVNDTDMKRLNALFNEKLATTELTPGVRFIAWVFALVNIPGVVLAISAWMLLPLTIPGLILYAYYWRIALDKLSRNTTRKIWLWTAAYNLALPVVFTIMTENLETLLFLIPYAGIAAIALTAWAALREEEFEPVPTDPISA